MRQCSHIASNWDCQVGLYSFPLLNNTALPFDAQGQMYMYLHVLYVVEIPHTSARWKYMYMYISKACRMNSPLKGGYVGLHVVTSWGINGRTGHDCTTPPTLINDITVISKSLRSFLCCTMANITRVICSFIVETYNAVVSGPFTCVRYP